MSELSQTYTILERLDQGGGGIVFKAYHKRLQKMMILKQIRQDRIPAEEFRRETDLLKHLNHSFLPQVYDFIYDDNGQVYTVMSYIEGQNLKEVVDNGYRLTRQELIHVGMELCSALSYLHSRQSPIIHSDIKPANIIIQSDGDVVLIDFNISFHLNDGASLGYSPGFSSPELNYYVTTSRQYHTPPDVQIDARTDIYSLGATLFFAATGLKYDPRNQQQDYQKLAAQVGEPLASVIFKALNANPAERYQSANAFYQALEQLPKQSAEYKKLEKTSRIVSILLSLGLAVSIVITAYGFYLNNGANVDDYNEYVAKIAQADYASDEQQVQQYFYDAREILPSELEAYLEYAKYLYESGQYDKVISFINQDVLANQRLNQQSAGMRDIYYLLADSYDQTGDYANALNAYALMEDFEDWPVEYYRDYAITLAHAGQNARANEVIATAQTKGLSSQNLQYANAEILAADGQGQQAIALLTGLQGEFLEPELYGRVNYSLAKLYDQLGNSDAAISTLESAAANTSGAQKIILLENLINLEIEQASVNNSATLRNRIIGHLNELISLGVGTYSTYDTLAVQYLYLENYEMANAILNEMLDHFGEDYNIYKRLAYNELNYQNLLDNLSRSYALFQQYYQRAKSLEGNTMDDEMVVLDNLYAEVAANGWI